MKKKKIELSRKLVLNKEHMLNLSSMNSIKGGETKASNQPGLCCVESTPTQPSCDDTRIPTGCVPFTQRMGCSQQITCPLQLNCL